MILFCKFQKQIPACRINLTELLITLFIFCCKLRFRFYRIGQFYNCLCCIADGRVFSTSYCCKHCATH